jgi:hypothetical protein
VREAASQVSRLARWLAAIATMGCGSPTRADPLPNEPHDATTIEAAPALLASAPGSVSAGREIPLVLRSDPPAASSASASAGTAQAPPCSAKAKAALPLGEQTQVDNRLVYAVAASPIEICVQRAIYPLMRGDKGHRGHQLWATVVVRTTGDEATFDLGAGKFALFHGYRVDLGLVMPRFSDECDVWVKVRKE